MQTVNHIYIIKSLFRRARKYKEILMKGWTIISVTIVLYWEYYIHYTVPIIT